MGTTGDLREVRGLTCRGGSEPSGGHRESAALATGAGAAWFIAAIPLAIAVANCVKKLAQLSDSARLLGNLNTFRDAAIAVSAGRDPYQSGIGQYVYPPLLAFLGQPLGWVSLREAGVLMLAVNLALSATTIWALASTLVDRVAGRKLGVTAAQVAALAAWLSVDSIRSEFNQWETNILMLLMFTLGLRWAERRPALAGAALGFAFNIKFLPVVLVPLLIARRKWAVLGAFAAFSVGFAMLPAASMGWRANAEALAKSYSGIARLLGLPAVSSGAAHVLPFTDDRSVSLPSAIGRTLGWGEAGSMVLAGSVGLIVVAAWLARYPRSRRPSGVPLEGCGTDEGWAVSASGMFAVEWVATMVLALVFSPYTNTGHLYLLLAANALAAVLVLGGVEGIRRWPVAAGCAAVLLGNVLPPGGKALEWADRAWHHVSGPSACMLVMVAGLIASGAASARREGARETADTDADRVESLTLAATESRVRSKAS
jgi:hypothetical protein